MRELNSIVIVGGGSAGWMAAAILAAQLPARRCRIEVIEAEDLSPIGVGESTVPSFVYLLQRLGIDEQEFMQATCATYKLGIRFVDWHQRQQSYFHPFGNIGSNFPGNAATYDFYQCWLRARSEGHDAGLHEFSPCAVMAENSRFFPPSKAHNTPIGGANYALHIDAKLAAAWFRRYALEKGVLHTEGKVEQVKQQADGFIDSVVLRDGKTISGDFFIDCTGLKALLIGQTLGVDFEDWTQHLPCDRAVAIKTTSPGTTPPYTLATARKFGWTWRIPLRGLVGHGYVFGSRYCSDAAAKAALMKIIDGQPVEQAKIIPFTTGRRCQAWKHNCLALGMSAGFVEPLESTTLHLIARGMDFFLRYFPDQDCDPALMREYNRRMCADYEEVRDFIVLHYCASQRRDTAFWRDCQQLVLPESLQARIELFRGHGALREGVDELFRRTSWQSVFEGMGIHPAKYCPRVNNIDSQTILSTLESTRSAIQGMVQSLPSHDEFLQRHTRKS